MNVLPELEFHYLYIMNVRQSQTSLFIYNEMYARAKISLFINNKSTPEPNFIIYK